MNPSIRARIKTKRGLVKQGYGPIYETLRLILIRHNPVQLELKRGDARDDYGAPVGTLIPKLENARREQIEFLLHNEMVLWYGNSAGESGRYSLIVSEFWDAWREFKKAKAVRH
jgi:hypothetical protein